MCGCARPQDLRVVASKVGGRQKTRKASSPPMIDLDTLPLRIAIGQFNELTDEQLAFAVQCGAQDILLNTPRLPGDERWELDDLTAWTRRAADHGLRLICLENVPVRFYGRVVDQSHIPAFEQRMLRIYSAVWIVGRVLAVTLLIFVQIPLFFNYAALALRKLSGAAPSAGDSGGAVTLLTGLFLSLFLLTGLTLWLKRLWPKKGSSV